MPAYPPYGIDGYCYATSNNGWLSSLPTSYPSRDANAYNPYGYYGNDSPIDGSTGEFFSWCEGLNLTLLVKRCLDALDGLLSNYPDMLVVLGELTEIADLFKLPKSAGDAYLQNQFGVSPTIGSIEDIAIGVSHRWNDVFGPKRLVVRQSIKGETRVTNSAVHSKFDCCWGDREPCPRAGRTSERVSDEGVATLELVYGFDPPDWGLTVLNKLDEVLTAWNLVGDASTLWELTRLSWMLDWFLPIGTIMKGESARSGIGKFSRLHVYMGYLSFRRVRTRFFSSSMYKCLGGETSVSYVTDEYVRVPLRNPWSWLDLTYDTSSAPHTLSQLLTVASLASK